MKESIHKYFKIGTIQWMSFPRMDGLESLKTICRDDYFDVIEVNTNKLGTYKITYTVMDALGHQSKKNIKAKYIRIGREPGFIDEYFALNKVLIYGKKNVQ